MKKGLIIAVAVLLVYGCKQGSSDSGYNLSKLTSPVIFAGDSVTAYRDPAVLFENGMFYLFFTKCEIVGDSVYRFTAQSESSDLINWSEPRMITPNRQDKNYSNPGNVVRFKDEWIMCIQSYPRPNYTVDQMPRYGNRDSRVYIIRSKDLINWSLPELLKVKGDIPEEKTGRCTSPFIIRDKEESDKWWCFYKESGTVSMSYSYDMKNWTPSGSVRSGDNVSIIVENNEYIMFHSPYNGIGIKKSRTLQNWANWGDLITLGQKDWEWAKGKVTGGTVLNMSKVRGINNYLMFFLGSGPGTESNGDFDRNSSIAVAWSKDLVNWNYPGKVAQ